MLLRVTALLALLLLTACAAARPPLFSDGTQWSFPVTVADDTLLTEVYIGDAGPYLFAVIPGVMTTISPELVEELDLYNVASSTALVSADDVVGNRLRMAEVKGFRVGDLELRIHRVPIQPMLGLHEGEPVHGVVGESVFDDTVVWTIDRTQRMVYLTAQEAFAPPSDAPIEMRVRDGEMFVRPEANGHQLELEVSFVRTSVTFPWTIENAGLTHQAGETYAADTLDFGNGVVQRGFGFVRFEDQRVRPNTLDGVLGIDFFRDYRVTVNMHAGKIWLEQVSSLQLD